MIKDLPPITLFKTTNTNFFSMLYNAAPMPIVTGALTTTILLVARVNPYVAMLQGVAFATAYFIEEVSKYDFPVIGRSPYLGAIAGGAVKYTVAGPSSLAVTVAKEIVYVAARESDYLQDYPLLNLGVTLLLPIAVEGIGSKIDSLTFTFEAAKAAKNPYNVAYQLNEQLKVSQDSLHHAGAMRMEHGGTKARLQKLGRTHDVVKKITTPVIENIDKTLESIQNKVHNFMCERDSIAKVSVETTKAFTTMLDTIAVELDQISGVAIAADVPLAFSEMMANRDVFKTNLNKFAGDFVDRIMIVKQDVATAIASSHNMLVAPTVQAVTLHGMPDKIVTAVANYLNLPTAPTSNLQNIALAEQALRVNPNNFYAHLLLGGIYSRGMLGEHKMDIDLAIHHLEEAGKVEEYYRSEPGFAASSVVQHSYLGYQYIKKFVTNTHPHSAENFLDQYVVRALEELHKAVAIDNTHVGSHLLLALTYMDIRDYDKAIISCKNVLALDPYNSAIYQKLGAVYREQGQLDEALEIYKQAVFYNASDAMLDKDMETAELAINIKGHFLELAGQMDNLLAALISNSYD